MHIILGIIGLLAAASFWIYRINAAARGAQELADLAGEAANLPRKMRFKSKTGKKAIDVLEDPREAAAVILAGYMLEAGDVPSDKREQLAAILGERFEISRNTSEEMVAQAFWMHADIANPDSVVNKMVDLVGKTAGANALRDLDSMLDAVAPSQDQDMSQKSYRMKVRNRSALHFRE